jgi:hypothetical protein
VNVLEQEDQRLDVSDAVHDLACGPSDLLRASLTLERLHEARGQPEDVRDGLLRTALAKLLERLLERVVVRDTRRGLDHLRKRPVRHAFPVRQRAAHENARTLDAVEELACDAALPDSGLPVDGEEVRATVADGAVEGVLEEIELRLASDERGARAQGSPRAVEHVDHPPGPKRPVDPLQVLRPDVLDDEAARGKPVRRGPDEDLPGHRRLLQARRKIHGLARRERRLGVLDDELTGLDADACLKPQVDYLLAHGERRASRPQGVVLVSLRNAESRQHCVAGELLHDPAML